MCEAFAKLGCEDLSTFSIINSGQIIEKYTIASKKLDVYWNDNYRKN